MTGGIKIGSKGASSGKASGGGAAKTQQKQQKEIIPGLTTINQEKARSEFLNSQNPTNFVSLPPDTIMMDGVEMKNIFGNPTESIRNGVKQYLTTYQATEKIGGGYPIFNVVVTEKVNKRKRFVTYEFDKSYAGTKFM